ncbi:MAG: hypothetical protein E7C86_06145 [Paeniclostridium sordellii]|uniref:Uncharacterized protein n=1 Tax=Paeniclostridium hominis TaxID=2764329 RepID=A0ABR7K7B4_9FIRM|nr:MULTISPECIES: hypothetical protein [Paeniclostridium]MBC6005009.1 hypothetical protein [Paeniclostridium hominis]MDU2592181.1 hypothetical protein [Paeniclostridium sordellii]
MKKEKFSKLSIEDKVNYLNNKLSEGQTVIRIREDIGIGEKALQKIIKDAGYKYNQKVKQYEFIGWNPTIKSTTKSTTYSKKAVVVENNTITLPKNQEQIMSYLEGNFDILTNIIERFKSTTGATTETTTDYIIIDLVDDKHLNPKPKSIRINEFVYRDWQEFCDKQPYSKMDLISMALKMYMEKYGK